MGKRKRKIKSFAQRAQDVTQLLLNNGEMTTRQIADGLGVHRTQANSILLRMDKAGTVLPLPKASSTDARLYRLNMTSQPQTRPTIVAKPTRAPMKVKTEVIPKEGVISAEMIVAIAACSLVTNKVNQEGQAVITRDSPLFAMLEQVAATAI